MARFRDSKGPSLPLSLLQEIGEDNNGDSHRRSRPQRGPRNSHRRVENGARRTAGSRPARRNDSDDEDEPRRGTRPTKALKEEPKKAAPITKRKREPEVDESEEEEEDEPGSEDWDGDDAFDEDGSDEDEPKVSKKVREKLAQEDKEIADLERKLGLKGKKGLPKSFKDDGLGDLLEDLGSDDSDEEKHESRKRKAEADEWLAQKRRKAAAAHASRGRGDSDQSSDDEGDFGLDMSGDGDDDDGSDDGDEDGFEGFDSEPETAPPPQPKRENPYVAPTTGGTVAKYVPPSMRAQIGSDAELTWRIRRQTQGLVNRLTDANLVSILGEIEKLYREHPRQHVTSVLSDLILVQVCDPSSLPDTLLILSAGFVAAAYKVIGMDFGAYLVQSTVERFKAHYENAVGRARDQLEPTKEASNIMTFLAQMYNFQMIGCTLIFDHIRMLLSELSELNAELLLRIIRMCGTALRQDDPMALKDIVAMIRPAMERMGEQNMSVRTKFMIETINDLKNNKMKAGAVASAVVAEHTTRMRKLLGSLSSRKLKATEPLRMGLKDIEESNKRGKWWLVGSSWAGANTVSGRAAGVGTAKGGDQDGESDSDVDLDITGEGAAPDVTVLAREQMMNTDVRRSIFVAIMSATDCEDAYHRLLKLRLNKERQREIANVLVRCAGSEKQYNPYYGLVARRLCADRRARWAFQDTLWKLFRRLGESMFGEAAEDEDDDDEAVDIRRIVNVAKLYGWLLAEGVMGLAVLKCLSLVYLKPKTSMLIEVLLVTAMLDQQQQQQQTDDTIAKMFTMAGEGTEDLARGLQYFVRKTVRKSDLAGSKANTKLLRRRCKVAELALERGLAEGGEVAE